MDITLKNIICENITAVAIATLIIHLFEASVSNFSSRNKNCNMKLLICSSNLNPSVGCSVAEVYRYTTLQGIQSWRAKNEHKSADMLQAQWEVPFPKNIGRISISSARVI